MRRIYRGSLQNASRSWSNFTPELVRHSASSPYEFTKGKFKAGFKSNGAGKSCGLPVIAGRSPYGFAFRHFDIAMRPAYKATNRMIMISVNNMLILLLTDVMIGAVTLANRNAPIKYAIGRDLLIIVLLFGDKELESITFTREDDKKPPATNIPTTSKPATIPADVGLE
jgi:hypothetical protein